MNNETKIMMLNKAKANLDRINLLIDGALGGDMNSFDQLTELDEIIENQLDFIDWQNNRKSSD